MVLRLFVLLLGIMAGVGTTAAQSDVPAKNEVTTFIAKYRTLIRMEPSGRYNYDEHLSPWIDYLKKPFDSGLRGENLSNYEFYQEIGECAAARKLEIVGFLNHNPQLSAAFQDLILLYNFESGIASELGRGTLRCIALQRINEDRVLPEYVELPAATNSLNFLERIQNREPAKANPVHQLMKLAICADYAPAIADILRFDKIYTNVLKPPESAYLLTRAFHKKIRLFGSVEIVQVARKSVPGDLRLELDAVGYMADPRKFANLLPSWLIWCAGTQFWRFKEEFVNNLTEKKGNR